jgi:Uncharacterized protein conserved in bacteria
MSYCPRKSNFLRKITIVQTGCKSLAIDAKGRICLPSKLRVHSETYFVTCGLDAKQNKALWVFTPDRWDAFEKKITDNPRSKSMDVYEFFISSADELKIDGNGRILISQSLRDYAGLSKDIVLWGGSDHIEIWDKSLWDSKVAARDLGKIFESMDELGI